MFDKSPEKKSNESGIITDGYTAYNHPFDTNPSELTRVDAQDNFNYFIAHKNEQVLRLKKLLSKNKLKLTGESNDIRDINKWINKNVCLSKDDFFVDEDGEKQFFIHPDWSNILFDLSIFISEIIIQNTDNVSWSFNVKVPSNEVSYQHPVLSGFSKIKSKGYYQNIGLSIFNYVGDIIENSENATDDYINFIIEDAILEDVDLENTMFDHTNFGDEVGIN